MLENIFLGQFFHLKDNLNLGLDSKITFSVIHNLDTQAIAKAIKKLGNSTKSWFIILNN